MAAAGIRPLGAGRRRAGPRDGRPEPGPLSIQRSAGCEETAKNDIDVLISLRHLARLERGDVLIGEILGPHGPAVAVAQTLILFV